MPDWLIQAFDSTKVIDNYFAFQLTHSRFDKACQTENMVPDKGWGHREQTTHSCGAQVPWNVIQSGQAGRAICFF